MTSLNRISRRESLLEASGHAPSELKSLLPLKTAPMRALRKVFSFPVMLASVLVVLGMLTVRARFDDPDMWWHLKMGQVIWTTHTIPLTDIFSYTTHHEAAVPQEWLAQVSMYAAYKAGALPGLMIWLCLLTAILLIAGYLFCSLYSGNPKVAFVGAMTIWFFATIGLSVRPQMIGYILLIFEMITIHLGQTRNPRWFFWLPVLFAVWINCHGSFFLGLLVAGTYLFSSFFEFRAGSLIAERWDPHRRWIFGLALVLSAAALFLNPDGVKQILYPINTLLHQPIGLSASQEWQPTPITDPRGIGLLAVLLCSVLLLITRRSELFWDEFLLIAAGTWLGLSHMRTLFAFGILAAPILSRQLSSSWDQYNKEADRIWPNALLIGISAMVAILAFPGSRNLETQVEEKSPVKAVAFIKSNHLTGPMLNDYTYGGYLIWATPEHPDFVDGRADVFEWSGVLREFGDWATLQSDPNSLLKKYKIKFCILQRSSAMAHVMPLLSGWKLIYSDGDSVIFQRDTP
jgi:hypothetical protein